MTSCFYLASNFRLGYSFYDPDSTIQFTDSDHILSHIQPGHTHVARLTLPYSDARGFDGKRVFNTIVGVESPFLYTTNRADLTHHQTVEAFLATLDPLHVVRENGLLLKFMDTQTPELCAAALEQNPCAIAFVRDATPEQCMDAIRKSECAIGYIKAPTEEMCLLALSLPNCDIEGIVTILFQNKRLFTPRVCVAVVERDGLQLDVFSPKIQGNPEVCLAAVGQNGLALEFVKEQTPEICMRAVQMDGRALAFVKEQTPEICIAAVKQTVDAVTFVKEKTPEILKHMALPLVSQGAGQRV